MTFKKFKEIVESRRNDIEVFQHDTFDLGRKTWGVGVIYKTTDKGYTYTGSYCSVLNKLGINAITKGDLLAYKRQLADAIAENGKERYNPFRQKSDPIEIVDNSARITELTDKINNYELNYVIV